MPPTVDVAAQMFMQASREYFELVPVLKSLPGYLRAALPDNERTRTVRRVAVLSASLGRKFITRGESVHMPYLLKRVLKERGSQLSTEDRNDLETAIKDVSAVIDRIRTGRGRVGRGDAPAVASGDHWVDVLYADILHSDYDRWARRGAAAWTPVFMHMWTTLADMRDLIADVRGLVANLARRGVLDLGSCDTTDAEDIPADDWTPKKEAAQ